MGEDKENGIAFQHMIASVISMVMMAFKVQYTLILPDMDFNEDLEKCLEAMKHGHLVGIPTASGWMLAGDATNDRAMETLLNSTPQGIETGSGRQVPVVLIADERDLLQYVSALDLAVFDWLDQQVNPVAIWFEGVLGLAENLLDDHGGVAIGLVKEGFAHDLIKRFRRPLAVTPLEVEALEKRASLVARKHMLFTAKGFVIEKFV
ncbi:Sua5/YciO/YrdC/YwlC family protein [Flavihumibacter profundi]|uniref:Sua5/YciO/YrdC/YwlC family protein n=1 Tax=Flavihumibacter profundi TaxID=2716883 RepID=UPI001CC50634|nr:Sua5/YciO/YrdC/YwlC family protein [Flavihumibacter profundi]MBZ5856664.1 Sua5/YciO/YrdC/YwlC family protein [Flavihumibacter profundi]